MNVHVQESPRENFTGRLGELALHSPLHASIGSTQLMQIVCMEWVRKMWPDDPVIRPEMRVIRFLEEALELAQAMGVTVEKTDELIGQVYGKPPGEVSQEIAGAFNTLLAVASSLNIDAGRVGILELDAAWERREQIRAKSKNKVKP